jgi:hypothetical protein
MQALEQYPVHRGCLPGRNRLQSEGGRSLRARRALLQIFRAVRAFCMQEHGNTEHLELNNASINVDLQRALTRTRAWNACGQLMLLSETPAQSSPGLRSAQRIRK